MAPETVSTSSERVVARLRTNRERLRHRLAQRDGGAKCRYCGRRFRLRRLTIDHVIPLAHGGTNQLENLVLACAPCNGAKGDQLWEAA